MTSIIHDDPRAVNRLLNQYFNSTRDQWIEIIKAGVAARARCTEDGPRSAPGFYAWSAATGRMRQMFRREGWEKREQDGIEAIVHHDLKKIVAVMNTDEGTSNKERSPLNRTCKGPASEKVVDLNSQYEMYKSHEISRLVEPPYFTWYLCIYDGKGTVRAELSRPSEFAAGYVVKFSERIFILQNGDWEKVLLTHPAAPDPQDFQINVRRI